jgi:hypothetical protein
LSVFSLRQVRKFSSRKLHSVLSNNRGTLPPGAARTAGPSRYLW